MSASPTRRSTASPSSASATSRRSGAVFLDDYEGNVQAATDLGIHGLLVDDDHRATIAALDRLLAA